MGFKAIEVYKKASGVYIDNLVRILVPLAGYALISILFVVALILLVILPGMLFTASSLMALALPLLLFLVFIPFSFIIRFAYFGVCYDVMQGGKGGAMAIVPWLKRRWKSFLLLAIAEILMIALAVIIVLLWMSVISASAILLILFLLLMVLILAVLMLSDLAAAKLAVGSGDAAVALTEAFGFAFANPVEFAVLLFIYCVVLLVSAIIPFGRFFIETQINGIALLTLASSKKAAN